MSKHKCCQEENKKCLCQEENKSCFCQELPQYIGETVTIYTTSGGNSGGGFTGVLMSATDCYVRLIVCQGPAPCCAIGDGCVDDRGTSEYCKDFRVGAVAEIPCDRIACFVHNAI